MLPWRHSPPSHFTTRLESLRLFASRATGNSTSESSPAGGAGFASGPGMITISRCCASSCWKHTRLRHKQAGESSNITPDSSRVILSPAQATRRTSNSPARVPPSYSISSPGKRPTLSSTSLLPVSVRGMNTATMTSINTGQTSRRANSRFKILLRYSAPCAMKGYRRWHYWQTPGARHPPGTYNGCQGPARR